MTKIPAFVLLAASLILSGPLHAMQATSPAPAASAPQKQTAGKKGAAPAMAAPSAQDIADAKAKGLVWCNLNTKVYHKDGAAYGTTKRGKFMTEDDAKKAGFREAKVAPGKKAAAAAAAKK